MKQALLWLHCLTPLHNGSGEGLGALDRPILREPALGLPYIQSPTIKGALRAKAVGKLDAGGNGQEPKPSDKSAVLFGAGETTGNRGCVSFTDAQVLLFPVRSLVGTFAWVTCPLALSRVARLLRDGDELRKLIVDTLSKVRGGTLLNQNQALGATGDTALRIGGTGNYCLEQLVRDACGDNEARTAFGILAQQMGKILFGADAFWEDLLSSHFLLLCDDDFTYLIHHATEVRANIRIGESGATEDGSLRYTEYLPAETVLWALATIEKPLRKDPEVPDAEAAEKLLSKVLGRGDLPSRCDPLQLGADESTGKGITQPVYTSLPVKG
jgi:CRISPR-associated protein Cmr4